MRTDELDYELPRELIATAPADPRDDARLLVVSASDECRLEHWRARDLPGLLEADDALVFNSTRVIPARFRGINLDTGGKVQGLYLRDGGATEDGGATWLVMLKARRFRPGRRIGLVGADGSDVGVVLTILRRGLEEEGSWLVSVGSEAEGSASILDRAGMTPLPPYILGARRDVGVECDDACDRAAYQTVFAGDDGVDGGGGVGSIAAPTAGLHFTPGLLAGLEARGIRRAEVVLHVGAGTFKPIEVSRVEDHAMHAEWCSLGSSRGAIFGARRVVAVGSTSARTIESYAPLVRAGGEVPEWIETRLLITPGYSWGRVDALLTNFHLPRSTLLAMVAALLPGGVRRLREIYGVAIREGYRFYSFGDAMLILP